MKLARLRQPAVSALAVLLISGAGIALAGGPATADSASLPTTAPAVSPSVAPAADPAEPAEAAEPAGADTDALQQGDQATPDGPAEQAAEAAGSKAENSSVETEKAGVEEPGDENLPGGGHADDPNDPTVDHQFEGTE